MVVESLLRPRNTLEQPKPGFSINLKEIALIVAISLFFLDQVHKLTAMVDCMLTSALQACVPVAQWIEHLPCWSLNEEESFRKNSLSGRPHMRGRP